MGETRELKSKLLIYLTLTIILMTTTFSTTLQVAQAGSIVSKEGREMDSSGNTVEDWGRVKITSMPNPKPTVDEFHESIMSSSGIKSHPNSVLREKSVSKAIIDAGYEYGINPYIMLAMTVHESGWASSDMNRTHTNPFGMRCHSRPIATCVNGWAKYKSYEDAYMDKAWLLRNRYVANGQVTFLDVIEKYAPPHENDLYGSGGYIDNVRKHTFRIFGLRADEHFQSGDMSPGENPGNHSSPTGMSADELFLPFEDPVSVRGIVNDGDFKQSPYISYLVLSLGEKVARGITTFGYILSAGIIGYIGVMVSMYVAYIKGRASHEIASKILSKSVLDHFGTPKGIMHLVLRMALGLIAMFFFLSGTFLEVMSLLYYLLGEILL